MTHTKNTAIDVITSPNQQHIHTASSSKKSARWMVLLLSFVSSFGIYYCCYLPSALESEFLKQFKLNHAEYNLFFSIFYASSIPIAIISGYLCDFIGISRTRTLFLILATMGQSVMFIGSALKSNNYAVLLVGRIIYGLGCESYQVANSALIADYFIDSEVFLSMALKLAFGRITTSFTYFFALSLFNKLFNKSLVISMLSGAIAMMISTIAAIGVLIIDKKYRIGESQLNEMVNSIELQSKLTKEKTQLHAPKKLTKNYLFWILLIVTGIDYAVTQGWLGMSSEYIQKKYNYTAEIANRAIQIIPLIPVILTPLIGFIIDRKPMRCESLWISSMLMFMAHSAFYYYQHLGIVAIVLLGIGYSIFPAVCWGAVSLIVDAKDIGKAIGMMSSFLALLLWTIPIFVGKLQDIAVDEYKSGKCDVRCDIDKYKYESSEVVWLALSGVSLGVVSLLWLTDYVSGKRLRRLSKKQKD